MVYSITGWSKAGSRQPVSYNLRAGQFRGNRVDVFPQPPIQEIVVKQEECDCKPKKLPFWAKFSMLFGVVSNGIGSLLSTIFGGKKSSEGSGDSTGSADALQGVKNLYGNKYNISCIDGKYYAVDKQSGTQLSADSPSELMEQINQTQTKAKSNADEARAKKDIEQLEKEYPDAKGKITYDKDKGYIYTDADGKETISPTAVGLGASLAKLASAKLTSDGNNGKAQPQSDDIANSYTSANVKNTPVKSEGLSLADVFKTGNIVGVFDDGKFANGKDVGDFANAKVESYNTTTGEIKIGGRTYKVVDQKDGYLYLEDKNPRGGTTSNRQIYILEKTESGAYQLHQREFLGEKTIGFGKAASGEGAIADTPGASGKSNGRQEPIQKVAPQETNNTEKTDDQKLQKWNAQHPDKKVSITPNGEYTTTVKVISTRQGALTRTVSAKSFDELQKLAQQAAQELNKRAASFDDVPPRVPYFKNAK